MGRGKLLVISTIKQIGCFELEDAKYKLLAMLDVSLRDEGSNQQSLLPVINGQKLIRVLGACSCELLAGNCEVLELVSELAYVHPNVVSEVVKQTEGDHKLHAVLLHMAASSLL